ncbi:MAG: hypothetical protein OTI37_05585 [Planctomycetota bacterium]|nr:hypothetical protein [Planctomycetota bacterium]
MFTKLIPIVGLLLCSCGIATQVTSIASAEHELFNELSVSEHLINLDSSGAGHFSSATIDAELHPRLAAAFAAGQAPSYPLIGRDHAQWVRSLDIVAGSDAGWHLVTVKALAPYPIRLSLIKREAQGEQLIANINSEMFNSATHFARLSGELKLQNGDVFIVRHEGARQAFENVITVTLE